MLLSPLSPPVREILSGSFYPCSAFLSIEGASRGRALETSDELVLGDVYRIASPLEPIRDDVPRDALGFDSILTLMCDLGRLLRLVVFHREMDSRAQPVVLALDAAPSGNCFTLVSLSRCPDIAGAAMANLPDTRRFLRPGSVAFPDVPRGYGPC